MYNNLQYHFVTSIEPKMEKRWCDLHGPWQCIRIHRVQHRTSGLGNLLDYSVRVARTSLSTRVTQDHSMIKSNIQTTTCYELQLKLDWCSIIMSPKLYQFKVGCKTFGNTIPIWILLAHIERIFKLTGSQANHFIEVRFRIDTVAIVIEDEIHIGD